MVGWLDLRLRGLRQGHHLSHPRRHCHQDSIGSQGQEHLSAGGELQRDPDLIALLADARRWRDDLLLGRAASIEELTTRERLPKGAISRVLPLAWLAPDISAAILDGRQPPDLTPARLRNLPELPLDWVDQRELLGFPSI